MIAALSQLSRSGGTNVKHLLSGVAIAAVMAIAAPVWAQAPSPAVPPIAAVATTAAPPSAAPMPRAKRPARRGIGTPKDRVADQLNRAELGRTFPPAAAAAPVLPAAPGYAPAYPPPPYPPPRGYPPAYYPPPWGYPPPYPPPYPPRPY
jgi:hypothetical protein